MFDPSDTAETVGGGGEETAPSSFEGAKLNKLVKLKSILKNICFIFMTSICPLPAHSLSPVGPSYPYDKN